MSADDRWQPGRLLAIARSFDTPLGLYATATLRLVLGAALFLVAPTSRAPAVLRVLGIVSLESRADRALRGCRCHRGGHPWKGRKGRVRIRGTSERASSAHLV